ncbi:LuxR family transcriptional regulator [Kitasatospora sp. NBC_00085]|uniref:LuxR family transcriptional regulator n=1 Tax=unclassified Kitasatospora TaxID=2633591 RepID=UPI003244A307
MSNVSDRAADELEEALLGVSALIESTVVMHRDRYSDDRLITTVGGRYDAILDTAEEMIEGARTSIDIMHARRLQGEDREERAERELLYNADPTVGVRLLTAPDLLDEGFVREQLGRERPVAIRVARVPPLQAIIVDQTTALVVTGSVAARHSSVIRVPEVIHTLRILFENVWRTAVPANERIVFGDRTRAAFARQILGALRAGVTDEVAARDLTVSVRTYRRYVAEIMTLLGASSRFQAGVRAAELGLLPPAGPDGRPAPARPGPAPHRLSPGPGRPETG